MNIALLLLGAVLVGSCSARRVVFAGYGGHHENNTPLNYTKQPRVPQFKPHAIGHPENNTPLNYTKQPRIPQFKPHAIETRQRNADNFVKCSKKTKKVTLEYGDWAYFMSPNHPDDYPKKSKCKWQFKSSDEDININIECYGVELEKAKKGICKKDILKIDSNKYCGSEDEIFYEGEKSVKVEFRSNKKKNYGGFICYAYRTDLIFSTTPAPDSSQGSPPAEGSTEAPPTGDPNVSCTCGQANQVSRIVGGEETDENEFPWQAAMVFKGTSQVFCGGSVIGSKHILTAAHCTQAVTDYGYEYQILVGAHSLKKEAPSQLRIDPSKIIQHKDYDASTVDNDIAIIVLSSSISFTNSEIRPVCLPTSDADDYDSVDAIVSGWGALTEGGEQPDVLMEVTVPTMTNKKCESYYPGGITDNMLCAGYKKGKKDSCQGDSGGPLIYNTGSGYIQIGVVSWGVGCAQPKNPGVYARVTNYLSWISKNIASSTKCSAP